jgi:hypothetical protein
MSRYGLVASVFGLLLLSGTTAAGIRPSFSPNACSWWATHIVVIDSTGRVIESWAGDLKPGEAVPLESFGMKLEHPVGGRTLDLKRESTDPERVTGKRLVLFLNKGSGKGKTRKFDAGWMPVMWEDFSVSAAWIEEGKVFALMQVENPGPQVMVRIAKTEEEFNKRVLGHVADRQRYSAAVAEKDPAKRAEKLEPLAAAGQFSTQNAIRQLGLCGEAGLPALRRITSDPKRQTDHQAALIAMGVIGPPAADDLFAVIAEELAYWKKAAPDLGPNWGGNPDHVYHMTRLAGALWWGTAFDGGPPDKVRLILEVYELWSRHSILSKGFADDSRHPGRLALDVYGKIMR